MRYARGGLRGTAKNACFGRCWRFSLGWRLAYRLPVPAELVAAHDEARMVA